MSDLTNDAPIRVIPDGVLSARAWGLYVYLLSRPDGWIIRVPHLQSVFTEGREAIYTALNEIHDADLMHYEVVTGDGVPPIKRRVLTVPWGCLDGER